MSKYSEAVEEGLKGLNFVSTGACPGCETCGLPEDPTEEQQASADEPHFTWSNCEACNCSLGGDRHPAHGCLEEEIVHLNVCVDCLFYIANGDEPEHEYWS